MAVLFSAVEAYLPKFSALSGQGAGNGRPVMMGADQEGKGPSVMKVGMWSHVTVKIDHDCPI